MPTNFTIPAEEEKAVRAALATLTTRQLIAAAKWWLPQAIIERANTALTDAQLIADYKDSVVSRADERASAKAGQ